MHIPWAELELFLAVAEAGSLSGAAKSLRVTQPTVSRRLAALEADLGEPLFLRRVDGAKPTAFGERLLEPARRMAESAHLVETVASDANTSPRGVVRITAPPGFAFDLIAPFAAHASERLPEVSLEVLSTVSYLDLVRREADLGVRLNRSERADNPRELVTLATVEHRVAAFATPGLIARLPRRYGFADVGWIGWPQSMDQVPPNPQLAAKIPGFRPVFASDDYLVQLRAAEAGVGAVILSEFRSRYARPSSLVPLKLDFGKLTSSLHLVGARASLAIPRVRAVADLLVAELGPVRQAKHKRAAP